MKRRKIENAAEDFYSRKITPKTKRYKALSSKYYFLKRKYERLDKVPNVKLSAYAKKLQHALPPLIYRLVSSQVKNFGKSAYGRRWSEEDKNMALQLYLSSSRAYNTLQKFFHLPTRRTIQKSISGINICPGFISPVFEALKHMALNMKDHDKLCTISFDEMKIKRSLAYYANHDQVIGFENCSMKESPKLATHALTFMVRGICKKWKQVFGIFFSRNAASSEDLKSLVEEAVERLHNCGLNPQCVICDMGPSNQRLYSTELAITEDKPFFSVNGKKIYALYDPPHLLKCLRNNFANYNVRFYQTKTADWNHIVQLYNFDEKQPLHVVKKLTKKHVELNGLLKMSVRRAAQVLSHSVASAMYYMVSLNGLPNQARDTAEFCSISNDLFDSVNSRQFMDKNNPLRSAVTKTSIHFKKWEEFRAFISSIKFETKGKDVAFPSLKGWQITLAAFQEMIPDLLNQIPFALMNRFNQDPLENYFSMVSFSLLS